MNTLGVIVLGHGGGVPIGSAGNTNFALVPGLTQEDVESHWDGDDERLVTDILRNHPYWLLDCGTETVARLCGAYDREEPRLPEPRIQNLQGVIITHCHNDHVAGLIPLAWRTHFVEEMRLPVIVSRYAQEILEQQLVELRYTSHDHMEALGHAPGDRQDVPLSTYFDLRYQEVPTKPVFLGGLGVEFFWVDHGIMGFPSFGVAVEHEGTRVVFSGDTAVPIPPVHFQYPVFHDCQFYKDIGSLNIVHCPFAALKVVPNPGKVWLTHTTGPSQEAGAMGFHWARKNSVLAFSEERVTGIIPG